MLARPTRCSASRTFRWLGLAGMLAVAGSARASQPVDEIPILYEEARIYLPVAAQTGPLGLFILDTGSQDCVIDDAAARKAGMRLVGEAVLHGAGRGSLPVGESAPVTLMVGGVPLRLESAHVGALDARLLPYSGRHVGGLIGSQLFAEHVVTVDFSGRRVALEDSRTFAYDGVGTRLPFRLVNGAPIVTGAIDLPDGSRLPLRLLIDLGAQADLLIAEPFARRHPELGRLTPSVVEPLGAGVGGETRFAFVRLPGVGIGPLEASDLIAGLSVGGSLNGDYYDALLGARLLQRYRVTFDYPRGQIILEPDPGAEPAAPFDRSGAYVIQDPKDAHRFVVHAVAPGSPASEAGLSLGDVVTGLGGRTAAQLGLNEIRHALADEEQQTVVITLARAGRTIETAIRLRSLL
jgi:hypothetical protein